jgi:hypothetical protein
MNFVLEVVQLTNTPLKEVLEFPIVTTLYFTCYSKDKHQYEADLIKKMKK